MRVDCLVEVIEGAREYLGHVIDRVPQTGFEEPGDGGPWSVKDILAHIAWHDDQMIELCETKVLAGSPWWELSTDERNAKIYEEYKEMPLNEVLAFFETAHEGMMKAVKTLSDEDLNDPKRFHDMPEDWTPWRMIANNTYEHYIRHIGQVRSIARDLNAA